MSNYQAPKIPDLMVEGTRTRLVRDLEAKPKTDAGRDLLLERARNGYYHCFETELATPKIQLYQDLHTLGYPDLAERCVQGDYDDAPARETSAGRGEAG